MDKFWEWAIKKDYAREWSDKRSQSDAYGICDDYGEPYIHRPQALIGYMIEYIFDTGNAHILDLIPSYMNDFNIDNYYAWLKNFVEEI